MSNSVQSERSADRSTETEPTLAELMDPAALERRLSEARERRAEALRAREEERAATEPASAAPTRASSGRPVALPEEGLEFARVRPREPEGFATPEVRPPLPPGSSRAPRPPVWGESFQQARPVPTEFAETRPAFQRGEAPSPEDRADRLAAVARAEWARARPAAQPAADSVAREAAEPSDAPRDFLEAPPAPQNSGWTQPKRPADAEPPRVSEIRTPTLGGATRGGGPAASVSPSNVERRTGGGRSAVFLSIFLIGLIGGGAAVLFAPPSFRAKIAAAISPPETTTASAPPATAPTPTTPGPETEVATDTPAPPPGVRVEPRPRTDSRTDSGAPDTPAPAEPSATAPVIMIDPPTAPRAVAAGDEPRPTAIAPFETTLASVGEMAEQAAPDVLGPSDPSRPPMLAPEVFDETAATPPAAAPTAPAPEVAPAEQVGAGPASPEAPATEVPAATLASLRVSVNAPTTARGAANDIVDALRAAGIGTANMVPVGFSVGATNVRYYHPEDRAAAEAVAAIVSTHGPVQTRDFTNFRPLPLPGIIEVLLSGQPGATRAPTPAPSASAGGNGGVVAATPRRVAQPAPATAAPRRDLQAEEVERVLLSREVERMLRQGTTPSE